MKRQLTIAGLPALLLLFAGCASTPQEQNEAVADNDEGVICRSETEMGSNMRKTVCTTKAERDALAQKTKEEITNRQRSRSVIGENTLPTAGN